jgi:anion-transporting  ArsA/GET3 family ATPase
MTAMASVLDSKLLVVMGKGGVGKSTVAGALALAAAARGLRTIMVELGHQRRLPLLLSDRGGGGPVGEELAGEPAARPSSATPSDSSPVAEHGDAAREHQLAENLWGVTIDSDRATLEWLQKLGGRVPGRVLANSTTFQYFAAAAPGARELMTMVKVWELTETARWRRRAQRYDLVVLDAPATGHALGLLHSPYTFGAIARVGPIFSQAQRIRELLEDPARTSYLAVTHPTEMSVGETLELHAGLRTRIGREPCATIVNATLPRRFDGEELARLAAIPHANREPRRSALLAAHAVHDRAGAQQRQIARLRRARLPVLTVPFVFTQQLDAAAVRRIGERLAGKL